MSGVAPVRPGDVVHVAERDYRYGIGALTLRITAVGEVWQLTDGLWVPVDGVPLRSDGQEGKERHALLRVAGIHRRS